MSTDPNEHDDLAVTDDSPHEACGVVGIYAPGQAVSHMLYLALYALQHRGQESAGMAVSDGDTLTVGPLAQTRMACSEEISAQANHVLAVLGQPSTVALSGDSLELTAADGTGLVYRAG